MLEQTHLAMNNDDKLCENFKTQVGVLVKSSPEKIKIMATFRYETVYHVINLIIII